MSTNQTDIAQIRKYLNGELDARAMHELEKRAQSDPFLMDALEGYETTGSNTYHVTADLQQRLHQRINSDQRKLIPWGRMAAAAIAIIVCGAGIWWYSSQQKMNQQQVAVTAPVIQHQAGRQGVTKAVPAIDSTSVHLPARPNRVAVAASKPPVIHRSPISVLDSTSIIKALQGRAAGVAVVAAAPHKDSVKLADKQGYTASRRKIIILGEGQKIPTIKQDSQRLLNQQILGRAEGAQVDAATVQHMVSGRLLDGADGQPLIGAQVKLKDLPVGTLTDRLGNFKIAAHDKDVLVLSSIGYESKEVKAGKSDSLNVALQPASSSLSEVVVMNYGMHVNKQATKAEPLMGWEAYQGYISHAQSPDHKTGHVKLSLTVNANGSLSDFTIIDGLSDAANQAAINLIKTGPGWRGNANGRPERVRVKVSFER